MQYVRVDHDTDVGPYTYSKGPCSCGLLRAKSGKLGIEVCHPLGSYLYVSTIFVILHASKLLSLATVNRDPAAVVNKLSLKLLTTCSLVGSVWSQFTEMEPRIT